MNYDRIILELLDRVSALEDEVKKLKEERTSAAQEITPEENEPVVSSSGRDTTKYMLDGKRYAKTDWCLQWSRSIWKCILIFPPLS